MVDLNRFEVVPLRAWFGLAMAVGGCKYMQTNINFRVKLAVAFHSRESDDGISCPDDITSSIFIKHKAPQRSLVGDFL